MQCINKQILPLFIFLSLLFGQFREDVPIQSLPSNLNGELSNTQGLSLFDPARFDIQHGFTMSMVNLGGRPLSMSGYTSHISYWASDNLELNAKIMLFNTMGKLPGGSTGGMQNLQLAYDAGITFKPTKNSFLKLEMRTHNNPFYRDNYYDLNYMGYSIHKNNFSHSSLGPRILE
tara:strand:+ start:70 stop:594 length:525 start_codon:yes stop_codon:yes gene_type:complete